jgi:hypothetical protein
MLKGRKARGEVAAEAPTDEDHALLVHFRPAHGEVDHGGDHSFPVWPEGHLSLPEHTLSCVLGAICPRS